LNYALTAILFIASIHRKVKTRSTRHGVEPVALQQRARLGMATLDGLRLTAINERQSASPACASA
jgi:hypothetical protein